VGRRVARTSGRGTAQYLYGDIANPFLVTAMRSENGVLTTFLYDDAGLLIAFDRAGVRYHVATDQVGSPRVVVDTAGNVVKSVEYDAWGNVLSDSDASFELSIGFAGGLVDRQVGIVRFGYRDYEPVSGRWTARDPVGYGGGQANLYAYANGDPINRRDPTGLWCIGASAYAGIGGGAKVCCTWDGCSACVEVGIGLGADLSAGTGDLDETGLGFAAEASASCGPLNASIEYTIDTSGCSEFDVDVSGLKKGKKQRAKGKCSVGAKANVRACKG
jgi:RHS repeat-associated protein